MAVTRGLVGQRCWWAFLPDGTSLQLELGGVIERESVRPGRIVPGGTWSVCVDRARWSVVPAEADPGRALATMEGEVTDVELVDGCALRLSFGNDRALVIDPSVAPDAEWSLFEPAGTVFVGSRDGLVRKLASE